MAHCSVSGLTYQPSKIDGLTVGPRGTYHPIQKCIVKEVSAYGHQNTEGIIGDGCQAGSLYVLNNLTNQLFINASHSVVYQTISKDHTFAPSSLRHRASPCNPETHLYTSTLLYFTLLHTTNSLNYRPTANIYISPKQLKTTQLKKVPCSSLSPEYAPNAQPAQDPEMQPPSSA